MQKTHTVLFFCLVYLLGHFLSDRASAPLIGEINMSIHTLKPVLMGFSFLIFEQKITVKIMVAMDDIIAIIIASGSSVTPAVAIE